MDGLTFIASIVKSLAWPTATVILVVLFKDHIVKLAPFIKKLKAGPLEAEFEREVNALKESTPVQAVSSPARLEAAATENFLFQLAELHPRSAILESWLRLEAAARDALGSNTTGSQKGSYIPAARLAEPLAQAGIISQGQVTLFHELRRLRNEVAHAVGFEPTQDSARSYIFLATFLQSHLEGQVK